VHRATLVLKEQGISRFILKAGGDIYASGQKEDGRDWRVGVQHPREKDSLIARFDMKDYAVSTSGDYERYVILDGRRYHHIVDPRTGYPGALSRSATVLAPTPEEADAMAKYLFLLGYEKAMARKDLTLPFLLVAQDGSLHYNEAFSRLPGLEMPVKP
jgi:thiamine biosynthesis lipoprotein